MDKYFGPVNLLDVLYAAFAAYILTNVIQRYRSYIKTIKSNKNNDLTVEYKNLDIMSVIKRCRDMFPIDTIHFNDEIFKTGMIVRVTTIQKKIIEGQLIGKNNLDFLCILTNKQIIAHEIDKIENIVQIEKH